MPYYSEEAVAAAKSISALQYVMDHESYNLKKEGSGYRLINHDSFKFSHGMFHWFSQDKGGKSAIDYLMVMDNMTFVEAVGLICDLYRIEPSANKSNIEAFTRRNEKRNAEIEAMIQAQSENKEFTLPEPAAHNKNVYAYLRKRGINDKVIKYCLNNKLIYQDKKHNNCVFVGYDEGKVPRYAGLRSTGMKSFKGDATGSNKAYSFRIVNKQAKTVHLFEAPIDLLSYATYMELKGYDFTKTNLVALAGIAAPKDDGEASIPIGLKTFIDNVDVTNICIHFDNDGPGMAAAKALCERMNAEGYETTITCIPEEVGKDMNDFLLNCLNEKAKKQLGK